MAGDVLVTICIGHIALASLARMCFPCVHAHVSALPVPVQDWSDRSHHFEFSLLSTCQVSVAAYLSGVSISLKKMRLAFCDAIIWTLTKPKHNTC